MLSAKETETLFSLNPLSTPRKENNKFTPRDIIIMLKGMNNKENKNAKTMQVYM